MGVNITMLILGVLLGLIGIENVKENIASIHWYNRTRITEETRPKFLCRTQVQKILKNM